VGFWKNVCCKVATKYALTTPTPVLYMESLADATKGKVKAADGEAEKKKKKEKEDTQKQPYKRNEVLQQRLQHRTSLAGPARLRPNALARLQQRACAPSLRAGPSGRLQQRACARSLRATRATGLRACLGRTQGGAFWRTATGATLSVGVSKWWPGRVLALQGGPH